jgi:adenylate kinase
MALDLILMGPPGAGKGTQAARVSTARGLAHIATGDMLRAAVRDGTPLGLEAKAVMARGDLVSDELVIAMFRERLAAGDTAAGVILDGFPRTDAQAAALDEMLTGLRRAIAAVIVFDIDEDTVVRRLSGRRMCRANDHVYHLEFNPPAVEGLCDIDGSELYLRDDDRPEVVRTRFQTQWVEAAAPVIEYYRGRGLVSNLDAARPQEQVSASLDALLDSLAGPS